MARKPDTPCAGCGKLLYGGTGSRPAGERKCRECRSADGEPPVRRVDSATTKAKRPHRTGRPWARLRQQVLDEETHCFRCGEEVDKTLPPPSRWSASVDHVVDVADGGAPLDRENVRLSHHGCNAAAGSLKRQGKQFTPWARDEAPAGLAVRGRQLWTDLIAEGPPGPAHRILIEEVCRIADRLDRLDRLLGDSEDQAWMRLQVSEDGAEVTVVVDRVLSEARQQAVALKQLVAELRQATAGGKPAAKGGGLIDQLAARRAARVSGPAGS